MKKALEKMPKSKMVKQSAEQQNALKVTSPPPCWGIAAQETGNNDELPSTSCWLLGCSHPLLPIFPVLPNSYQKVAEMETKEETTGPNLETEPPGIFPDESDDDSDVVFGQVEGICCFCHGECNPSSQACGRCARAGTAYAIGMGLT